MMIYLALLLSIQPVCFSTSFEDTCLEKGLSTYEMSIAMPSTSEVPEQKAFGCDDVIFIVEPFIVPAFYQAITQIIAEGTLLNGSTVFRAGEEVILAEDFEINEGATLEIQIGPCIF